jgi:PAS domain S-box-containing protein
MIIKRLLFCCALLLTMSSGPTLGEEITRPGAGLALTAAEQSWLSSHRVVRVRIGRSYPPFEFFDQGHFQGMAYDHLVLMGKLIGIEFRPVSEMSLNDALTSIRKRDGVDLILLVTRDRQRAGFLELTSDYLTYPQVIISRKDGGFISGIKDLAGTTVVIEDGGVDAYQLKRDIPGVNVLRAPTAAAALNAVALGRAHAYIGDLAGASYLIDSLNLVDLKVAAPSSYPDDRYAMGVRKDWPELASILDKALIAIPESQHRSINQKWLTLRYDHGIRPLDVLNWFLVAVGIALVFIFKLRRMVRTRTAALELEIDTHEQTLASLRLREDELQSIYMATPIGLAHVCGRVLIKVNEAMCRMMGYTREELIGQTSRKFFVSDAEFESTGWLLLSQVQQTGQASLEVSLVTKEGVALDVVLSYAPMAPGNPSAGFVAAMVDVTQRKKTERAVSESKALFQAVFDESPITVVLSDPATGAYVDVNNRFCQASGATKESVLGKTPQELGMLTIAEQQRFLNKLCRDGKIDDEEVVSSTTGAVRTSLLSTRLIEVNGKFLALSMLLDITARKQAEEALRDSEKQQRLYLSRLPIACILWGADFAVKSWNPAAERVFGYSAEEAQGKRADELIVPVWVRPKANAVWNQLMEGDLFANSVNENVTKDGRIVVCEWTNTPYCDGDGQVLGVISMAQDITGRKRAEALMIQTEKMSLVASMAAGMAHEVNNPLGIIAQDLQNLERRFSPALAANRKVAEELGVDLELVQRYLERRDITNYVTSMRSAVKRASLIIANMLSFSRTSDDSRQLANLNEVIEQSLQLASNDYDLRKKYDFKNLAIERNYSENLPPALICIIEIEQVFINLFKNAAQALFEAGTLNPSLTLETSCSDRHVVVSIRDNGPGIPEEIVAKIFDPFFTTKDVGSGTGLGLSVSYAIVNKNHGGEISVASVHGEGACFTVRLPVYQKE